MRSHTLAAISLIFALTLDAHGQTTDHLSPALQCEIGPVTKIYGGAKWLAYSCNDDRSVVVVSAPDNPAAPFYFLFSPGSDGYRLHGEGTGNKSATDAAYKELSILSERDIANLIAETKKQ